MTAVEPTSVRSVRIGLENGGLETPHEALTGLLGGVPEHGQNGQNGQNPKRESSSHIGQNGQNGQNPAGTPWDQPIHVTAAGSAPPWPAETLPETLGQYLSGVAEDTQTSVELAGTFVLAALSAAALGRLDIESVPGHREPGCLYVGVVLPPGERKTAVVRHVTGPLREIEREQARRSHRSILEAKLSRDVALEAAKSAEKLALEGDNDAFATAIDLRSKADSIRVPAEPRFLADDATPEALVSLLAEQGGRMAVLADEGAIFAQLAGRYSKNGSPNLEAVLQAHTGGTIRVDRKGRTPEYVDRATLTIGVSIQPDVLRGTASQPEFRGRGLIARFLWSVPEPMAGHRKVRKAALDQGLADWWHTKLAGIAQEQWDRRHPRLLTFDDEAQEAFYTYSETVEVELRQGGNLHPVRDWGSKLPGAVARIAGLLHLLDGDQGDQIGVNVTGQAIALGRYFAGSVLVAMDEMGLDETAIDAIGILDWLARTGWPGTVSKREIQRAAIANRDGLRTTNAVGLLVEHGWLRRSKPAKATGRPPETYDVNPAAAEAHKVRRR